MLKMGGETPVSGHRRPLVVQNLHFRCSHRDHGLNTQHHAGLERQRRFRGHNVVGNFGFFVQRRTDAVPNKPSYHMEPGTFGVFLHSASDVVEFITGSRFGHSQGETVTRSKRAASGETSPTAKVRAASP